MIDRWSDIFFGPIGGPFRLVRAFLKILVSIVATVPLYLGASELLTNIGVNESDSLTVGQAGEVEALSAILVANQGLLETEPFRIIVCGERPASKIPCSDPNILLGVQLAPAGEGVIPAYFAGPHPIVQLSELFGFVTVAVELRHSIDSLVRVIEGLAFNEQGIPPSALRLCAGTRRVLGAEECLASSELRDGLSALLSSAINQARWATLLLGPIQFVTLAVFLFLLLEAGGRWARWIRPDITLVDLSQGNRKPQLLAPEAAMADAVEAFSNARVSSIGDEMVARAIVLAKRGEDETLSERERVVGLEGFREYLVGDAESKLDSLGTMNETMLKLAFAGTVVGVGLALMIARGLDTADPIEEILTKAEMFGAIGSAFGTTLVGIFLSIAAGFVIQWVYSSWLDRINASYRMVLAIDELQTPLVYEKYGAKIVPPPIPDPRDGKFLRDVGWLVVLGVLLAALGYVLLNWASIFGG